MQHRLTYPDHYLKTLDPALPTVRAVEFLWEVFINPTPSVWNVVTLLGIHNFRSRAETRGCVLGLDRALPEPQKTVATDWASGFISEHCLSLLPGTKAWSWIPPLLIMYQNNINPIYESLLRQANNYEMLQLHPAPICPDREETAINRRLWYLVEPESVLTYLQLW